MLNLKASAGSHTLCNYALFVERLLEVKEALAREGVAVEALSPHPQAQARFLQLPLSQQDRILCQLREQLDLYAECSARKERLVSTRNVLEILAYRQRLVVPEGLLEKIQPNTLVELYDHNLIQRFRSVNFFRFTSHCLEDLESRPFFELFRKSKEVEAQIYSVIQAVLSGATAEPDFRQIARHKLWEINSPKKFVTENRSVAFGPVYSEKDGSVAGILHICKVIRQAEFSLVRGEPQARPEPATTPLTFS